MTQHTPAPPNPYARAPLGQNAATAGDPSVATATDAAEANATADGSAATAEDEAALSPDGPEQQLGALQQQVDELKDQLLRGAAELDNVRKRGRREVDDARRQTKDRLLCDMLPVVDNLDRALVHAKEGDDAVNQGVRMVLKQFQDFLGQHQVTAFVSLGTPFDPSRHEAIGQEPSAELPPHTVLRELQQGYTIEQRLLRPARVVVAMAPPEPGGQG